MRTLLRIALALACLSAGPAFAQAACSSGSQMLLQYIEGGGYLIAPPTIATPYPPGSKVTFAVNCEGSGQFPPPTIAGATYSWSSNADNASTQRIEVTAPAAGVEATYSVTVNSPSGGSVLTAKIVGAALGTPLCTVSTQAPQPVEQDTPFVVTAQCSPAATTFQWTPKSYTGSISIVGPNGQSSVTLLIQNTQPGDVMPIYLTASNAAGPAPFASLVVTAAPSFTANVTQEHVAGGGSHSCAVTRQGGVKCWGNNATGQLGDFGNGILSRSTPANVIGAATGIVRVVSGYLHSCVLTESGGIKCWGENSSGQLGDSTGTRSSLPVDVFGLASATQVATSASSLHTCAVAGGAAYCWGRNDLGQLGTGDTTNRLAPAAIPSLASGVVSIAAGGYHSCALISGGTVKCWGRNSEGQLGNGATLPGSPSSTPVTVTGLTNVVAITAGHAHSCAIVNPNRTVKCWGYGVDGELGDGTFVSKSTPVDVVGLTNVNTFSAAGNHTCTVPVLGGFVNCWGRNTEGQLGDGTLVNRNVPVATLNIPAGLNAVSAGGFHSCAIATGGTAMCWGNNPKGERGDGTYVSSTRPAIVVRENAAGALDANNWFLDLDVLTGNGITAALTPPLLVHTQRVDVSSQLASLGATVKYQQHEYGTLMNNYVFGLVPIEFFSLVKLAPGALPMKKLRPKAGSLYFAQLTPQGWTNVDGQLIAFSSGTATGAGASGNILNGVPPPPGSRFCVGYGQTADAMLSAQTFREVLVADGSTATASGLPCVLSGVYLSGSPTSIAGTSVAFTASVVGLAPGGTVQFKDGVSNLLAAATIAAANPAVGKAAITTASLALGPHSIGAAYSGDTNNPATNADVPLLHTVTSNAPGTSSVKLTGPVSSASGEEVTFSALVEGANPTGTVQFMDGASPLGAPQAISQNEATLRAAGLSLGSHAIKAVYGGDGGNASSMSSVLTHTVLASLGANVELTSSPNPAAFGSPITLTAAVTGNAPTGQVVFKDGAATVATASLAAGSANALALGLASGVHQLTATYSGDANNPAVTSSTLFQEVLAQVVGTTPSPFAFTARTGVGPGQDVTSGNITVSGVGTAVPIVVAGGTYSIGCNGAFAATGGMVSAGQKVCVRHTAAATVATATHTTLTIGGISATFTSTTWSQAFATSITTMVTHYYTAALGRTADAPGQAFWEAEAARMQSIGANINEAWFAMAQFFFFSAEYLGRNRNDTGFATDLYATFFNRAPDGQGLNFWVTNLQQGMPREVVLASFMFSTEFANFTQAIFGNTAARAEVNVVMDFYRGLLARLPDPDGFTTWVNNFRTAQCQGTVLAVNNMADAISSGFANGGEYVGKNRTNAQYVGDLYNAFLRRGGDLPGVQTWINFVNNPWPLQQDEVAGTVRERARRYFVKSPEFQARVNAIVAQGCIP